MPPPATNPWEALPIGMPTVNTLHFGLIEYAADSVIEFPSGLPAFEDERAFVLLRQPDYEPLLFVQSLSTQLLAFLAIGVQDVRLDYQLELTEEEFDVLGGAGAASEFEVLALISVSAEGQVSANLQAPLVIHRKRRRAIQVTQSLAAYSCQHPLGSRAPADGETPCS